MEPTTTVCPLPMRTSSREWTLSAERQTPLAFNSPGGPYDEVGMSSERRRLLLGTSWTFASTLVALVAGTILNPVLVLYLGVGGFGTWASAFASVAFGLGDVAVAWMHCHGGRGAGGCRWNCRSDRCVCCCSGDWLRPPQRLPQRGPPFRRNLCPKPRFSTTCALRTSIDCYKC